MYHKTLSVAFFVVIALAYSLAPSQRCEAQGLLRRIQSRIQARVPETPAANPKADATDSASAGKRVQPLTPAGGPGAADDQRASAPSSAVDGDKFGVSVLQRESDASRPSSVDRPSLGIDVLQARGDTFGARVTRFRETSQADDAGLMLDDIIVAIDGKATPTIASVSDLLRDKKPGDKIRARVVRGTETKEIDIPLVGQRRVAAKPPIADTQKEVRQPKADEPLSDWERVVRGTALGDSEPDAPIAAKPAARRSGPPKVGLKVIGERGIRGAKVTAVTPDSRADRAGLRAGDRIVSVDGFLVLGSQGLVNQIKRQQDKESISIKYVRDGAYSTAVVSLAADAPTPRTPTADVAQSPGETTPSDAPAEPAPDTKRVGATVEGIGSLIGGLLGGDKPADAVKKAAQEIQQAAFDEELPSKPAPKATQLPSDPPSVDSLELPADVPGQGEIPSTSSADSDQAKLIETLRAEIRQLRERLQELESKD